MTRTLCPLTRNVFRLIVVMCLGGPVPSALAQTIVWTDANARKIQRRNASGGAVETIVEFPSPNTVSLIHYDPIDRKLYYVFHGAQDAFQRSNLDGSNSEIIPTPSVGIFSLNVESRMLFWITQPSVVNWSELDGSAGGSHDYTDCCVLTIEAVGEDLYFGAGGFLDKGIWRADADGSNEQFLHGTSNPMDLAYDPLENKIYMSTILDIVRINPDGTGFESVLALGASGAQQLAVDHQGRKLYWADRAVKVIKRSNLDGSNVETFVTAAEAGNPDFEPHGLTIVAPAWIPATSDWGMVATGVLILVTGVVMLRTRFRLGER